MYLRMAKRLLLETDKRLLWKLAWNMGFKGSRSVMKFKKRLKKGEVALGVAKAAVLTVRQMMAAALERPSQAVPRDTTSAYATLAVIQAEAGDAAGAFETAEEMRTHALRLWLAANEADIGHGLSDDTREEERTLEAEVRGLLAKRECVGVDPVRDHRRGPQLRKGAPLRLGNRRDAGVRRRRPESGAIRIRNNVQGVNQG